MSTYEQRVRAYEAEGMTRSDAQGIVDLEDMRASKEKNAMSTPTHTPGPWRVEGHELWSVGQNARMICDFKKVSRYPSNYVANAALIKAAPELLAELKTVREWINQLLDFQPDEAADAITNNGEDVTQRIDDLLAKAEGRA